MAFLYFVSVSLPPGGALNVIGFVPLASAGKRVDRICVALWLSVPGSTRLSLVCCPVPLATAASATTIASQSRTTTILWRTQRRPSAYRGRVIARSLGALEQPSNGPPPAPRKSPSDDLERPCYSVAGAAADDCTNHCPGSATVTLGKGRTQVRDTAGRQMDWRPPQRHRACGPACSPRLCHDSVDAFRRSE